MNLLAFAALLSCLGLCGCPTKAEDTVLSATQIVERTKPATVEVLAQFEAKVEVVHLDVDLEKLKHEVESQLYGSNPSKAEIYEKFFNVFYSEPGSYLSQRGDIRHLDKKIYALGSGFIVSPDGYVVTNAHVVQPEEDDLKKSVIESVVELVDDDAGQVEKALGELLPGDTVKSEASERLRETLAEQYAKTASFDFASEVHVLMPAGHGDEEGDERKCELKKIGKPVPGKDIAILKMDGTDLPTVPLATSIEAAAIRPGENLYVLGYPGTVALDAGFTRNSRMQPSLTTGHVSGIKDMTDGWQVIQTDAPINPGNSGGPVLNDRGEVVGLATFQEKDSQGLNFAVSVDLARQFLDQLRIRPRESDFTKNYDLALAQYDRPGHGHALKLFRELSDSHPDISGPREFVTELSKGTITSPQANQPDRSHPSGRAIQISPTVLILAGVGFFLVLVILIVVVVNR